MKTRPLFSLRASFALAALLLFTAANSGMACVEITGLISQLPAPTKTAVFSGNFSDGATWGGSAPTVADTVVIPENVTVTVDNTTPIAKNVIVNGTLNFSLTANTKLQVETLILSNGKLIVGDFGPNEGVPVGITASIVILDLPAITQDSLRLARGIIASCSSVIRMNSAAARAPFVTFSGNIDPTSIGNLPTTTDIPATWQVGDQIVIPSTTFTRLWVPGMPAYGTDRLTNEVRTIAAITYSGPGRGIILNTAPTYSHTRADTSVDTVRVHAANLTRNIVISSGNTTGEVERNGHVMFMGHDVQLNGVRFANLGRTDKLKIASDPGQPTSVYNAPGIGRGAPGKTNVSNPRARYSCHFHKAGPDDPMQAVVTNCAATGTPGWAFVNHSSHVNFSHNVAFDFDGSGFVAEDGDETGEFIGNIAIGGLGNGEFAVRREIFDNSARENQGDMGFTGSGFWFTSPDLTITNNVAAGCKGTGFFFWTAGKLDPNMVINGTAHFTGRPLTRPLPRGVKPRKWDYNADGIPDAYMLEDFPVLNFSDNIAYGCFTGLRLRFVNNRSTAIFKTLRGLSIGSEIIGADGHPVNDRTGAKRANFTIQGCTFWNNLNGVHGSYLSDCTFKNITVLAAGRLTEPLPTPIQYASEAGLGALALDFPTVISDVSFSNVTVNNYTTGIVKQGSYPGVTFTNCSEIEATAPNDIKSSWFLQARDTDNIADNPQ